MPRRAVGPRDARSRLRVCIFVSRMDVGGVPDHIGTLLHGLGDGIEATLICDHILESHRRVVEAAGHAVVLIPVRRTLSPVADVATLWRLSRLLRRERFDILHTHTSKPALLGGLVGAVSSAKVVNTAHNLGFIAMQSAAKRFLFRIYDALLCAIGFDRVIFVSQRIADRAVEAGVLPRRKVAVIPNGIRLERFQAAFAARPARSNGEVVITVARLVWFKGLHTLVDAMPAVLARRPQARLLIVGDGELRESLELRGRKLGLADRIAFLGERDDVPDILGRSDLFVLPSVSEGMPISIMEAMATGLPVVATAVGGVPELVEDGVTGRLVPPEDPAAMAAAILAFLEAPDLLRTAGRAGRARLERCFSAEAMAAGTAALYRSAVHGECVADG